MKLLNRYVINTEHAHAVRWEQIGRILEVSGLEVIRMNSSGSDNVCQERFKATLSKWLRIDAFASWKKLESALNQALRDIEGIGTGLLYVFDYVLFSITVKHYEVKAIHRGDYNGVILNTCVCSK